MGEMWSQLLLEGIMMRTSDLGSFTFAAFPAPLSTQDTPEKFPSGLHHQRCSRCRSPLGTHAGPASRGDADAQLCAGPNSSGEAAGASGQSWDSWCHRGISGLGRLTECLCQLRTASWEGTGPPESMLSLQPGARQNQHKILSSYGFILLKREKMRKERLLILSNTRWSSVSRWTDDYSRQ